MIQKKLGEFSLSENPLDNIAIEGGFVNIFRTIGCIGDSLASGEHEYYNGKNEKIYNDLYEYSWGQYIARKCGSKVYNFSVGGLRSDDFHDLARYQKTFTKEKECQAYIIALGSNDVNHIDLFPDGFGSIEDIDFNDSEKNKKSFVGYYVKILQRIRKLQPDSKIFLMTMPEYKNGEEERENLKTRHAELLCLLPKYFKNTYVIDFRKYLAPLDEDFINKYFLGWHLNAMGYKIIADSIINYIDWIIKSNYNDFKKTGLIGNVDYESFHNPKTGSRN